MLLLADDDGDILRVMEFHLRSWGYQVVTACDKSDLFRKLDAAEPKTLLLDLFFGEDNGIEVLTEVRERFPDLPVLILTGHGSIESAVRAMRQGAYDFLTKPPDFERLRLILKNTVERHDLRKRVKKLEEIAEFPFLSGQILGRHDSVRQLTAMIENVAPTDATVLILGETGSGKELIARALHDNSPRKETGPFIPMNMANLPSDLAESALFGHEKGAFTGAVQSRLGCCEAAEGGTLFLDEIGEMDLLLQSKLLRFLQDKTVTRVGSNVPISVDVRVVAATNQNLAQLARQGKFREDLYYRLNVISVVSPPLRERREDIPLLASHFLQKFALKYRKDPRRFDNNSTQVLLRHDWPGNIRQLENLIERLVVLQADYGKISARAKFIASERDQLRVNASLVSAEDARVLWSEAFDGRDDDQFALQGRLAEAIAAALRVRLTPQAKTALAAAGTADPVAHDLVQRARFLMEQLTPGAVDAAIGMAGDAIARDSGYVDAWLALAQGYVFAADDVKPGVAILEPARRAIRRAQALAPDSPDVLAMAGMFNLWYERDSVAAGAALRRALALDSTSAVALTAFASLADLSDPDSAGRLVARAVRHNPTTTLSLYFTIWAPQVFRVLSPDSGQLACDRLRTSVPPLGDGCDASRLAILGRRAEAAAAWRRIDTATFTSASLYAWRALVAANIGDTTLVRQALASADRASRSGYVREDALMLAAAHLGDRTEMLRWTRAALRSHAAGAIYVAGRRLDRYRGDAAYEALRREAVAPATGPRER